MNSPIRRMRRMRTAFNRLESELKSLVAERKQWHATQALSQPPSPVLTRYDLSPSTTATLFSPSNSGSSRFSSPSIASPKTKLDMEDADERSDLLHNLVKAAMLDKQNGLEGMTDGEIVGNTYIYFL